MTLVIDSELLRELLEPCLRFRKDSECRIDVTEETLRFRAVSEDLIAYLDITVGSGVEGLWLEDGSFDFCVKVDRIASFMTACEQVDVKLTPPSETSDSRVRLQANGLTGRFGSVFCTEDHSMDSPSPDERYTEFSLHHRRLDNAVRVADLVGNSLTVSFNSVVGSVEFFSDGEKSPDSFIAEYDPEETYFVDAEQTSISISIDRLRDVLRPLVPETMATLRISDGHLFYRAEYPAEGATVCLYNAERLTAIR